jgi:hypothetical protein
VAAAAIPCRCARSSIGSRIRWREVGVERSLLLRDKGVTAHAVTQGPGCLRVMLDSRLGLVARAAAFWTRLVEPCGARSRCGRQLVAAFARKLLLPHMQAVPWGLPGLLPLVLNTDRLAAALRRFVGFPFAWRAGARQHERDAEAQPQRPAWHPYLVALDVPTHDSSWDLCAKRRPPVKPR